MKRKDARGGVRTPGIGKKIGRPKLNKKKRTFSLTADAIQILDELSRKGFNKSDVVDYLVIKLANAEWYGHGEYRRVVMNLKRVDGRKGRHKTYIFDRDFRELFQK